jgi:hypothetical protein
MATNTFSFPSNTASLGAIAGASGSWLGQANGNNASNNLTISIDQFLNPNPNVKTYEVFETTEDLLALSVTWERIRKQKYSKQASYLVIPPSSITDKVVFDQITVDDRIRANIIRDYYEKKIVWWTLNDIKLTPYRQDLKKFISSDGKTFQGLMKPLAYRLPEFYDYDVAFDELVTECNMDIKPAIKQFETRTLTHIKTLEKYSKRYLNDGIEYWFKDTNNHLTCILIRRDNPLKSLLDNFIKTPINVNGQFKQKYRDTRTFFTVDRYTFE